jgi:hypothetical protein
MVEQDLLHLAINGYQLGAFKFACAYSWSELFKFKCSILQHVTIKFLFITFSKLLTYNKEWIASKELIYLYTTF